MDCEEEEIKSGRGSGRLNGWLESWLVTPPDCTLEEAA